MYKLMLFLLSILLATSCKTTKVQTATNAAGKRYVLKMDPGPDNPRNSEGAFLKLKSGRLLYVYTHYTGSSGKDWGNAFIASRYSDDSGDTWSKEDKLEVKQEGDANVMSVSLVRLKDSSIAMINLKVDGPFACSPWIRISTDEAQTWGAPWKCITDREGYFGVNNDRIVQLGNGRLLMPVVQHNVDRKVWDDIASRGIIWNFYSDDNGKSWKSGPRVAYPPDSNTTTMLQEPGVVTLKNGEILMYNRTLSGSQFLSHSRDNGESFSAAMPSNIPSPISPALIKRIPSTGDLLLVWNNNGANQKRTPLSVAVSKDDGKTWLHIKDIEDDPSGSFAYPAIGFVGNDVLVAYCAGGLASTYITKLSLDWIYQ